MADPRIAGAAPGARRGRLSGEAETEARAKRKQIVSYFLHRRGVVSTEKLIVLQKEPVPHRTEGVKRHDDGEPMIDKNVLGAGHAEEKVQASGT